MSRDYELREIRAVDLYSAGALFATAGAILRDDALAFDVSDAYGAVAVSIDDKSEIRDCVVILDGDRFARPLVGPAVIRESFKRIRVAPFWPSTFCNGAVALPAGSSPATAPPIAPATLRLRIWRVNPEARAIAPFVSVQQVPLVVHGLATAPAGFAAGEIPICFARFAEPPRTLVGWASNDNLGGEAAAVVNLWTVRPQVPDSAQPATAIRLGKLLATATLPSSADNGFRVELPYYFSGCLEYVLTIVSQANKSLRLSFGFEAGW